MIYTDVEHLPIAQLSPADEIQVRRALRRNRLLATGLLALMIVIAIAHEFLVETLAKQHDSAFGWA